MLTNAPRGPVQGRERMIAPDVARGLALLGIALANVVPQLWGRPTGPGLRPVDGSGADRAVDFVVTLLVDNRAYPLFAMLLGYGTVVLLRRQEAAGTPWPQARALLVRRGLALVALGAAHLLLLFLGDVLLPYGLVTLVLVLLLRSSDRRLRLVVGVSVLPLMAFTALDGASSAAPATEGCASTRRRCCWGSSTGPAYWP